MSQEGTTTVYNDDLIIELKPFPGASADVGTTESFAEVAEARFPMEEYTNPWDKAHQLKRNNPGAVGYVEPDIENLYKFKTQYDNLTENESFTTADPCSLFNGYDDDWPFPADDASKPLDQVWHLGEKFSQLKLARDEVKNTNNVIRIAHFDTGYDPSHICYADNLIRHDLERNFVETKTSRSAVDKYSEGPLRMPGHGTGTLSILAGAVLDLPNYEFKDSIGLNYNIEIVPVRVSKSVILFKNTAFAEALDYIISLNDDPSKRCHIVTMSMGGAASKHWAEKVNEAYEKGIFIVTAAGNNFGRSTPRTLVYPARFNRVVAACGVTYDYSPYYKSFNVWDLKVMQGNFGPRRFMKTAIAAFTPNVPWAKIGCRNVISLSGAGTSSATPQVASAAALYYQKYYAELEALPEPWMKVETLREAMFSTALKKISGPDNDIEIYFGNGILQANEMLKVAPSAVKPQKAERDKVFLPLLFQVLSELSPFEAADKTDEDTREMFETELLQLIQDSATLQRLLKDEEKSLDELRPDEQLQFFNVVLAMPQASETLKKYIRKKLGA